MSARIAQDSRINILGSRLELFGVKVDSKKLQKVLKLMNNDIDLAVDAFMMSPPPKWLTEMVGDFESKLASTS